jgi:hypothetical protein
VNTAGSNETLYPDKIHHIFACLAKPKHCSTNFAWLFQGNGSPDENLPTPQYAPMVANVRMREKSRLPIADGSAD